MNLAALQGLIMVTLSVSMLIAAGFAFIDAASRRADAFVAADKLTKPAWLIILGLSFAALVLMWPSPLGLLQMAAIIATLVYLVDVRPALQSLTRR